MFRLYSKRCEYAIRALINFDTSAPDRPYPAGEICRKARIPESFTRKVFQALVKGGFLKAVPGPGGGYRLSGRASRVRLADVIEAVDGKGAFGGCVLGRSRCNDASGCVLHETWKAARENVLRELENKTLKDLMDRSHARARRVTHSAAAQRRNKK